jgi:hypothetical protein
MYLYAFLIPIFDRSQSEKTGYYVFILFLAGVGYLLAIVNIIKGRLRINKFHLLLSGIILFGLIGALINFRDFDDLRSFFTLVYLGSFVFLVYQYLSQHNVMTMFVWYGIGTLVAFALGGFGFGERLSDNELVNSTTYGYVSPYIVVFCFERFRCENKTINKLLLMIVLLANLYLGIQTGTRTVFFLYGFVLLAYFIFYFNKQMTRQSLILLLVIIPVIVFSISGYFKSIEYRLKLTFGSIAQNGLSEFLEHPEKYDYAVGYRIESIKTGLYIFRNNPFGIGFGNFSKYANLYMPSIYKAVGHPHNSYIEVLVSSGIGGTILSIIALFYLFKRVRNNPLMLVIFIMVLIMNLTSTEIYHKMYILLFASAQVLNSSTQHAINQLTLNEVNLEKG